MKLLRTELQTLEQVACINRRFKIIGDLNSGQRGLNRTENIGHVLRLGKISALFIRNGFRRVHMHRGITSENLTSMWPRKLCTIIVNIVMNSVEFIMNSVEFTIGQKCHATRITLSRLRKLIINERLLRPSRKYSKIKERSTCINNTI